MKIQKFEQLVLNEVKGLQTRGAAVKLEDVSVSYNQIHGLAALYCEALHPAMFVPLGAGGIPLTKPASSKLSNEEITDEQRDFIAAESLVIFQGFTVEVEGDIQRIKKGDFTVFTKTARTGNIWNLPLLVTTVADLQPYDVHFRQKT